MKHIIGATLAALVITGCASSATPVSTQTATPTQVATVTPSPTATVSALILNGACGEMLDAVSRVTDAAYADKDLITVSRLLKALSERAHLQKVAAAADGITDGQEWFQAVSDQALTLSVSMLVDDPATNRAAWDALLAEADAGQTMYCS